MPTRARRPGVPMGVRETAWQSATGCDTPAQAAALIKKLRKELQEENAHVQAAIKRLGAIARGGK